MPQTAAIDVNTDAITALNLKIHHNLSYSQTAKLLDKSKQTIHRQIKHLVPDDDTKYYQQNRAGIWDKTALRLLSHVTDAKLKKMSARDAIISAGICYDKSAAERGQANVVIAYDASAQWARVQELRVLLEQNRQVQAVIESKSDNMALQVIDITDS